MSKLYISGPITGTPDFEARFSEAEKRFPEFKVINPVTLCADIPEGSDWFVYMDRCLEALRGCTHIWMMPGWRESKGACVEFYLARHLGMVFA